MRDIFSCRMQDLLSACGILLRHVGSLVVAFGIFVKASGVFNCGRQDLHCAIWGVLGPGTQLVPVSLCGMDRDGWMGTLFL